MKYRVTIHPMAVADLDGVFAWIAEESPGNAVRWYQRLLDDIRSLASFPHRCPIAPESDALGKEIRQLLFGDYRVLFMIDGTDVHVLRVRHAMRRPFR
jgi:plasmid stabilization system protein ParE